MRKSEEKGMEFHGKWIESAYEMGDICPVFQKKWKNEKAVEKVEIVLSALGVYKAEINGKKISDYVLAPGWTVYEKRIQYQSYDVTELVKKNFGEENELQVIIGKGWFSSPMPGWVESEDKKRRKARPRAVIGEILITYTDGGKVSYCTDSSWKCGESAVSFSEIYDGESYDARFITEKWKSAQELKWPKEILIPQEGEEICEIEEINVKEIIHTPSGEIVIDFGQEITGYVEFELNAHEGDKISILHSEVLDQDGNFYNDNYRSAKARIDYVCREGMQKWHPELTFFGFRYIKLETFPGKPDKNMFKAIVVHSRITRTGKITTGNAQVNQLLSNIFWGQRDNFLDVPTDCPQRDERLGWTGDAQVFVKAASYNYDVEKFFRKWLHDLAASQREDGAVGQVIPDYLPEGNPSAAWGDAATICPWQIYLTYGNKKVLEEQFDSMKRWVDYITSVTTTKFLWTGGEHFGDWLGLDAPSGSYKGSTRENFVASAFYAYSTQLVVKAGEVLGKNMDEYKALYENILAEFRKTYSVYTTQTEHVLAVQFNLSENPQKTVDSLVKIIKSDGYQMKTGFVGTPYILHVLSNYGYSELAYTLFLREEYPSWLYSVKKGATTIWEHWDGIMEDGSFWSTDMNSFNHYAYGSVIDWVYEKAAGIQNLEKHPGFAKIRIKPEPDERLVWLEASIQTRNGIVSSKWAYINGTVKYEIYTEVPAEICINGKSENVLPGRYVYWGKYKI